MNKHWKRTKEKMYKSVKGRRLTRDEQKKKRAEHIKEYLLIMAAMLLIFLILLGIMSL